MCDVEAVWEATKTVCVGKCHANKKEKNKNKNLLILSLMNPCFDCFCFSSSSLHIKLSVDIFDLCFPC